MKHKPIKTIEKDKNGNLVINLASNAANDDWIRAARLTRKAKAGDEEAAKELKRLYETPLFPVTKDDE